MYPINHISKMFCWIHVYWKYTDVSFLILSYGGLNAHPFEHLVSVDRTVWEGLSSGACSRTCATEGWALRLQKLMPFQCSALCACGSGMSSQPSPPAVMLPAMTIMASIKCLFYKLPQSQCFVMTVEKYLGQLSSKHSTVAPDTVFTSS